MDCKKYSELLDDLAADELDAQLADDVSMHVFACAKCEAEFDKLKREQEIYSRFLFEIEPPKNLSQSFQARLESEFPTKPTAIPPVEISFGKMLLNSFSPKILLPITAACAAILIFGFVFFRTENPPVETARSINPNIEKPNYDLHDTPTATDFISENTAKKTPQKFSLQSVKPASVPKQKIVKVLLRKPQTSELLLKESRPVKTQVKTESAGKNLDAAKPLETANEENLRLREIRTFEEETAKQMEKIELLLRSFRNARFSEETEQYDVAYEQRQARRFLQNIVKLREKADVYGDIYAVNMFEKIEPFLLDIANLDENPSTETILDIKRRIRNQNLIASLQGF